MLVLRPVTLMANWADVGALDAFLAAQAARYAALAVPTIALAGDADPLAPPSRHAEKLAAAAPVVKVIVLPGFGHMLHHAAADRSSPRSRRLAAQSAAGQSAAIDLTPRRRLCDPTKATRIMLVAPGVPSGTPATMMTRWPALANPSLKAIWQARSTMSS